MTADQSVGLQGVTRPEAPRSRFDSARAIIIEPSRPWPGIKLDELLGYWQLFFYLVWRDIKVRYAQTVLGAAWAIIQPVLTMVVFTLIFGKLAGIQSDGLPYALFSLTALVPWSYFSTALNGASNSLISNPALITKIYFPRLVLPAAPVLAGLVDFVIAFLILLVMAFAYGFFPSVWALLLIPGALLIAMVTALGTGSWLAALNVRYRDVKYVTPFLVQIWMYMSPIVYPASLVPERFRLLYSLNPMVSVVEGFRLGLTGASSLSLAEAATSAVVAAALLLSGALYFRRAERVFADVV